ncbi:hypothetical protein A3K80_04090 [Candidatus Bathyarchaeota archaeon RBG_13_38_9]|nr:MAG: hypothetical protein A3K80_04090 [Candidatus Bathyarchaeota archaeon RBG_13_38_9]
MVLQIIVKQYITIGIESILENEATAKRRILGLCQDNSRNQVEIIRKLALMIDSITDKKTTEMKDIYKEMLNMIDETAKSKLNILDQIASLGPFLMNREDFLRLTFRLSEITDNIESVAFRLISSKEKKIQIDMKYMKGISLLSSLILDESTKMRETLMSLTFNPTKALEMASAVEDIERKIDNVQRELEIDILTTKLNSATLLLKDIIERLEKTADIIISVLDQIRVLAVST